MKTDRTPRSGKLGDRVAYRSRYGQCERRHVRPRANPTAAKLRANAAFAEVTKVLNQLTEEQFAAWAAVAKTVHSKPRNGQSGPLTAQMLFNQLNRNQVLLGLPILLTPPERPSFGLHPVGPLHITREHGKPVLTLPVAQPAAGHLLVYASRPHNAARRYCDKFTYLGVLPPPVNGQSDLTPLYIAQFGSPPPNTRVFVKTLQQINGWRSLPLKTHALVPALQPAPATASSPALA